jgi:hypothetical protein
MITQELLNSEKANKILQPEDLDTSNFILSLFGTEEREISKAINYLKKFVNTKTPIEELALKYIALNFQTYKEIDDTIIFDLSYDDVYESLIESSALGFYALLKEFITPYTADWELEQISTYSPLNNVCEEKEYWVSKKYNISFGWSGASKMMSELICSRFNESVSSLNKGLYKKLDKKELALFFDIEEFEANSGYDDFRGLKDLLLNS